MYDKSAVLKIDLKTWNYGHRSYTSNLMNGAGMMCCLGFECQLRGIESGEISGIGMPNKVDVDPGLLEGLIEKVQNPLVLKANTIFSMTAAVFNDTSLDVPFTLTLRWPDLPTDLKIDILKITNNLHTLVSESNRQAVIKFLFKYYLDREVVFV
jgi:hypothetical protein